MELKIVGKIELPKSAKKEDPYRIFSHFAERLKERYNLDINKKEYKDLCKSDCEILADRPANCIKIKVIFQGVYVLAIRKKGKNTLLITALPQNH